MFPGSSINSNIFTKGLQASKSINWSSLLDGTQKTLGVINQAIPIVYQVKPLLSNAKAMFKIADALNTPSVSETNVSSSSIVPNTVSNKPIFYI